MCHYQFIQRGIDPDTTLDELIVTHINTPLPSGGYMYIQTMFYGSKSTTTNRAQIAIPYATKGSMFHRYYYGGAWSAWRRHVNEDEIPATQTEIVKTGTFESKTVTAYYRKYGNVVECTIHWVGTANTNYGVFSGLAAPTQCIVHSTTFPYFR